uniref:Root UVB sensitive protein C-terminal domain-containing protein n=1 Tax=Dunaliella tertiolecta TaxID=3047 RepID=A0A7S3QPP6_DUNTE
MLLTRHNVGCTAPKPTTPFTQGPLGPRASTCSWTRCHSGGKAVRRTCCKAGGASSKSPTSETIAAALASLCSKPIAISRKAEPSRRSVPLLGAQHGIPFTVGLEIVGHEEGDVPNLPSQPSQDADQEVLELVYVLSGSGVLSGWSTMNTSSSSSSSSSSSAGSEASPSAAAPTAAVISTANLSRDMSRGHSSATPSQHSSSSITDVQGGSHQRASDSPSPSSLSPQEADTGSIHSSSSPASPSPSSSPPSAQLPASNGTTLPLQDRALSSKAGAASTSSSSVSDALQQYLALYSQEQHVLVWRDGEAHVLLHEDAGPHALLQAMWQAAWLHNHQEQQQPQHPQQQCLSSGTPSHAEEASVQALRQRFPSFVQEAGALGYELDRVSVHRGTVRVRVEKQ